MLISRTGNLLVILLSYDRNKFIRYVYLLSDIEDVDTPFDAIKAHVEHLKNLEADEKLVLCGPFSDFKGGIVIFKAESITEAKAVAEADPFVKGGYRTYELRTLELSCAENDHMGIDSEKNSR